MTIRVNESLREFSSTLTLQELINELQVQVNGIAVAVNENVIKKENWNSYKLKGNDNVLIIKSTQGG
ncbi:sulfur carrier protein ThiS [Tenacibaculum sp. 1B UA]|uniref:sulfur carrier protein ThiS n=1 Tax=unclassified Tenacibaculum TaxID=2635139 RepID=UPI0026E1D937|nr:MULTISPECIES: sulfur carrier protein ThiS [unclassified Tenacibaculum]MDO6674811.1 sulfur carrier protein ThiS [Tenacibaculum sp. 1_MG-2023]MDX8553244.1 sulfur carrier protein ThiS [Tenacibaculum sp. 1B UA]